MNVSQMEGEQGKVNRVYDLVVTIHATAVERIVIFREIGEGHKPFQTDILDLVM